MDSKYSGYETRGRPTRNPKNRKIQCRIDEETDGILVAYCEKRNISESEAIREGIRRLANEITHDK